MEEEKSFDRNYAAILALVAPNADSRFFGVKSPELQELCDHAQANLVRLVSLMLLPAMAAQLGGHEQVLAHVAEAAAGIPPNAAYRSAAQNQAVFDGIKKLKEQEKKGEFQYYYQCESSDPLEAVIRWYPK